MLDWTTLAFYKTKWGYSNVHLSNKIIFTTVRILKPNAGQFYWTLSGKKSTQTVKTISFFLNNTYPYEEIAISCSKVICRNIQWIMNFGMWVLLLKKLVSFIRRYVCVSHTATGKEEKIRCNIKTTAYLNVRPCSVIKVRRRFTATCSLSR